MTLSTATTALSYDENYRLGTILSATTSKIITAAPARIYEAAFGAPDNAWKYTGYKGVVVFGYDSRAPNRASSRSHATSYWFRLVDLRRGKILWAHDVCETIEYEADKPFFHIFGGKTCKFGFRFDEDEDAEIFLREVTHRIVEIPMQKPSSSTGSPKRSPPTAPSKPKSKPSASHRRAVDRSAISAPVPDSFKHVAHMADASDSEGDDSFNVAPEWTKLLRRLEGYGIDAGMVEENFEFVKGFLAGAEAMREPAPKSPTQSHVGSQPSWSRGSSRQSSLESLDYSYEQDAGYYGRSRRHHTTSRKPAPIYQY